MNAKEMRTKEEYQKVLDNIKVNKIRVGNFYLILGNHIKEEISILQELIDNYKENK